MKPTRRISSPEERVSVETYRCPENATPAEWAAHFDSAPTCAGELHRAELVAREVLDSGGYPRIVVHLAERLLECASRVREYVLQGKASLAVTQTVGMMNSLHALEDVLVERTVMIGKEAQDRPKVLAEGRIKATPERIAKWNELAANRPRTWGWKTEAANEIAQWEREQFGDGAALANTIRVNLKD